MHDELTGHGTADADAEGHLSGRIDLLSLQTVKGLEFDAIVVVEPAGILAQRPDGGAGASTPRSPAPPARWPSSTPSRFRTALAAAPDLRRVAPDGVAAWLA